MNNSPLSNAFSASNCYYCLFCWDRLTTLNSQRVISEVHLFVMKPIWSLWIKVGVTVCLLLVKDWLDYCRNYRQFFFLVDPEKFHMPNSLLMG